MSPEGRAALQVGWDTVGGQPPPASRRAWCAGVCVFGLVSARLCDGAPGGWMGATASALLQGREKQCYPKDGGVLGAWT